MLEGRAGSGRAGSALCHPQQPLGRRLEHPAQGRLNLPNCLTRTRADRVCVTFLGSRLAGWPDPPSLGLSRHNNRRSCAVRSLVASDSPRISRAPTPSRRPGDLTVSGY